MFYIFALIYVAFVSLVSIIITITDKAYSVRRKERVSENFLLFLSTVGGALAMYLTMIFINHKTRRIKFMLGLPLIFTVHIILIMVVYINF